MDVILFVAFVVLIVGGGIFIWRQSQTKGRWGLSRMFGMKCPKCGTAMPTIRKPTSMRQALWGGWTCPNCGATLDKYGREQA
jgi:predicted RNA-binding Zn-ribbon protein involved in translation (DUF1610 family)